MIKLAIRVFALCAGLFLATALVLIWDGLNDDLHKADFAVVLGSKVGPDGIPSVRLKARLDHTVQLYRDGWFPKVIVSGGVGKEGFDEALVMKQYLVSHGIPAEHIIEDNQGLTTFATARNTARILREKKRRSVLVVSQYFHISRSVLAMKRCGVAEVYSTHPSYFEWRDLYSIPREMLAYARYMVE